MGVPVGACGGGSSGVWGVACIARNCKLGFRRSWVHLPEVEAVPCVDDVVKGGIVSPPFGVVFPFLPCVAGVHADAVGRGDYASVRWGVPCGDRHTEPAGLFDGDVISNVGEGEG